VISCLVGAPSSCVVSDIREDAQACRFEGAELAQQQAPAGYEVLSYRCSIGTGGDGRTRA
jgi:hypothetical protein